MGDFFQILIIVSIVVIAIVKQISKVSKETADEPPPYKPPYSEEAEEEFYQLRPEFGYASADISKKNPTYFSSAEVVEQQTQDIASSMEAPDEELLFNAHSIEEVRRAIIWSEIINRKY